MPRLTMNTPHSLGQEEAARRLKEKFSAVREELGGQVSDLHEQWDDHTLSFGFKTMGMKVSGEVAVHEDQVKLNAQMPLAAAMFKGMIETKIREELGDLLA